MDLKLLFLRHESYNQNNRKSFGCNYHVAHKNMYCTLNWIHFETYNLSKSLLHHSCRKRVFNAIDFVFELINNYYEYIAWGNQNRVKSTIYKLVAEITIASLTNTFCILVSILGSRNPCKTMGCWQDPRFSQKINVYTNSYFFNTLRLLLKLHLLSTYPSLAVLELFEQRLY